MIIHYISLSAPRYCFVKIVLPSGPPALSLARVYFSLQSAQRTRREKPSARKHRRSSSCPAHASRADRGQLTAPPRTRGIRHPRIWILASPRRYTRPRRPTSAYLASPIGLLSRRPNFSKNSEQRPTIYLPTYQPTNLYLHLYPDLSFSLRLIYRRVSKIPNAVECNRRRQRRDRKSRERRRWQTIAAGRREGRLPARR